MEWIEAISNLLLALAALLVALWLHRLAKPIAMALMGIASRLSARKVEDAAKLLTDVRRLLGSNKH